MARTQRTLIAKTAPERAFDFVADLRNERQWNPNMLDVQLAGAPEAPLGAGSLFRITGRVAGHVTQFDARITRYERPRVVSALVAMRPMRIAYTYTVVPVDGGARIAFQADVTPLGFMKLLAPLVGVIFGRQLDLMFPKLVELLAAPVQTAVPTEPTASTASPSAPRAAATPA
jgi:hypothetical protein